MEGQGRRGKERGPTGSRPKGAGWTGNNEVDSEELYSAELFSRMAAAKASIHTLDRDSGKNKVRLLFHEYEYDSTNQSGRESCLESELANRVPPW